MDHFLTILMAESQKLTFVQKWIIFAYFVKKGPKFVSHDSLSGNNEKINYLQKVQKWTIFWPFWWQKSQKLTFVQKWIIFAYFVKKGPNFVSHDSLSGNNEKINYLQKVQKWTIFWPFWWQKSQKLTFVQKWIIFAYFVKKGPKFVSHDSLSRNNEKINYLQKVQKWTIFWPFWWQKSQKLTFVRKWIIFAYFVEKGPNFVSHDFLSRNNEKINYIQNVLKWTFFDHFDCKKSQKLTAVQKWIIFAYFVKKGPKFVSHDSLSRNNEKINYLQNVQK